MRIVSANGLKLAFESFGKETDEAVLLIAGLGTQMIRWSDTFCMQLVDRGYRVIRFDNRDAGYSTHVPELGTPDLGELQASLMAGRKPSVPYSLLDMAGDAVALLDALSIDRAHVIGRSMGGMIAQIIASEYPEHVRSLTSIMSSSGNPALPQASVEVMTMITTPSPDPETDREGFLKHRVAFARLIAAPRYGLDEDAYRALITEELRRNYDAGGDLRQLAATATGGDRRSRLATIQAPALIIHGTDDPLIPPACGEDTAASISGATLLMIDGMGHDIQPALYGVMIDAICQVAEQAGHR